MSATNKTAIEGILLMGNSTSLLDLIDILNMKTASQEERWTSQSNTKVKLGPI